MVALSTSAFGQVTLLNEDFEGTTIPSNWSIVDNDGFTVDTAVSEYTQAWIIAPDPEDTANGTASSTSYFSPVARADRWLITPQLTLGSSGNYVSWASKSFDPSFPDSYKVMVSTTGNNIADFTDTLLIVNNATPFWKSHTEALAAYASQSIYLAFVNMTYNGYKLFLDSVYVRKEDPLAVKENTLNIAVYPNPVQNVLNIQAPGAIIQHVQLTNINGETIFQRALSGVQDKLSIPLHAYQEGVYFLTIQTSQGIARRKLIKH